MSMAALTGGLGAVAPGVAGALDPGAYEEQGISWEPCFDPAELPEEMPDVDAVLECGSFQAPRDWKNPASGVDVTIAVSRLAPPGGAQRSLLTNPGGPGGPGRTLPLVFAVERRTKILAEFEIIGIDVRGTGDSTNVTCLDGTDTGAPLDPRDRRPVNTDLILDATEFAARICQEGSRDLGPFITTEQTVKDLDLLRVLLGREKISWLGYSGGTWMGAYYATFFPERVDRFVLDANADFTAPWQQVFDNQPLGFQRRFDVDFLPYAARNDDTFHLGATAADVNAVYEAVRARLAAEPLDLGDGLTVYAVDLDSSLTGALYSKGAFQGAAELLGSLRDMTAEGSGDTTPAPATRSVTTPNPGFEERRKALVAAHVRRARELRRPGGGLPLSPDAFPATFYTITCNDTPWMGDRRSLLEESQRVGTQYPLAGWHQLSTLCVFWNRPAVTLPTPTGAGIPPVLMVQTQRDPATPFEGAARAAANFRAARLLTVADEGDHGSYAVDGNACVDDAVEAFLLDGTEAPESCPGKPIPDPEPEAVEDPTSLLDVLDNLDAVGTVAQRTARLARLVGPLPL